METYSLPLSIRGWLLSHHKLSSRVYFPCGEDSFVKTLDLLLWTPFAGMAGARVWFGSKLTRHAACFEDRQEQPNQNHLPSRVAANRATSKT